jgi:hypothetical protein
MSRGAATHGHARAMERLADCGKMTAQLRTDLAQGPTLCIRVGRTFNVHGVTVAAVRLDVASRDQVAISPAGESLVAVRESAGRWRTRIPAWTAFQRGESWPF